MSRLPNIIAFGDVGRRGLFVPGMRVYGAQAGGTEPDTGPIDMTTERLDPRISYLCESSHAYIGADGLIHYAAPNEWPLEYRNGVAVGRHEPEPMRTNYLKNSALASSSYWPAYQSTITPGAVTAPDGSLTALITNNTAGTGHGVYQLSNIANPATTFPVTASCFAKTASSCQLYLERSGVLSRSFTAQEGWQYGVQHVDGTKITPPYLGTLVFYSTAESVAGDTYSAWGLQVETGECSTSPIITASTTVTRAAGFVPVLRQGANGLRVIYDVGDPDIHVFPDDGDSVFYLPYARYDWGYRLITEIQYITADIRPIDLTAAVMDERISFGRASAKTYWAADGTMQTAPADVWPVEHDPVTGEALGRWCEPMRTNYLLNSATPEKLATAIAGTGSTITNVARIDGAIAAVSYTATTISANAVSAYALHGANVTTPTGVTVGSVYIRSYDSGEPVASFYHDAYVNTQRIPLSSSWTRASMAGSLTTGHYMWIGLRGIAGELNLNTTGHQVEFGDYPTSFIPTGDVAVTRSADFPEVPTQGMQKLITTFHDGTTETVDVSGADSYLLPSAQKIYRTVNYG